MTTSTEQDYYIPDNIPTHKSSDGEEFVRLRSAISGRTLLLSPDIEERDYLSGAYAVKKRGDKVKFIGGVAQCPVRLLGAVQANKQWNVSIFFADDARATTERAPTQAGMAMSTGAPGPSSSPSPSFSAPDGWDSGEVSDLIGKIKLGEYDKDLNALVAHEVGHRNRSQLVVSLSKRVRDLTTKED